MTQILQLSHFWSLIRVDSRSFAVSRRKDFFRRTPSKSACSVAEQADIFIGLFLSSFSRTKIDDMIRPVVIRSWIKQSGSGEELLESRVSRVPIRGVLRFENPEIKRTPDQLAACLDIRQVTGADHLRDNVAA